MTPLTIVSLWNMIQFFPGQLTSAASYLSNCHRLFRQAHDNLKFGETISLEHSRVSEMVRSLSVARNAALSLDLPVVLANADGTFKLIESGMADRGGTFASGHIVELLGRVPGGGVGAVDKPLRWSPCRCWVGLGCWTQL